MKQLRSRWPVCICAMGMVLLILDSRCAAQSAQNALELCLRTLVPGLFPLFVLSAWMVPRLGNVGAAWLGKWLQFPSGSEGLFLLGLAGGFPMGAACISQAVSAGTLSRHDANRMLGICNNCGPAFLFGVVGGILQNPGWTAALFLIQAEAALLTGMLWPGGSRERGACPGDTVSLPEAVRRGISAMANVCAWVILANVTVGFLGRWLFPLLEPRISVFLTGLLELTSGCFALAQLGDRVMVFSLAAFFVCFGGFGVMLQIQGFAAPAGLSLDTCLVQKAAQGLFAAVMAALVALAGYWVLLLPLPLGWLGKKAVEIPRRVLYNTPRKGGT